MTRIVATSLALALLSGCLAMRQLQVRRDLLQKQLEQTEFAIPLDRACRAIELLQPPPLEPAGRRRCDPCVDKVRTTASSCTYQVRFRPDSPQPDHVVSAEVHASSVRVRIESADPADPMKEGELRRLWLQLDSSSAVDAQALDAEAEAAVLEESAHFTPRNSFTAGLQFSLGASHQGLGLRGGLRRWQNPYLIFGALLEAEWTDIDVPWAAPGARSSAAMLTLPVRAEFSLWSDWTEHALNLPEASFYLFAGPAAVIDSNELPGSGLGWRAGVGAHILHASHSVPCYLEVHLNHVALAHGFAARGLNFTVGLGL